MEFCLEVSESLLYTKGGHNAYIAKKRAITKKDRNSDIQKKGNIFDQFEKGTLIGAIIVVLTGLAVYGHISKIFFFLAFQLSPVNVSAQGFSTK